MPQNNIKPNDRPGFSRFRPRGGPDDNTPKKGPKFNIYWVWAVIAIILLGYNFLGSGFTPDAHHLDSEMEFRNNMLEKGDVAKLVLVTNKNLVRVYIKKDSLNKDTYKDLSKNNQVIKTDGPQYEFQVTKIDEFEKRLYDFFAKNPSLEVPTASVQEGDWIPGLLQIALPILIILLIWVMLMRKMGGQGGSGGPGGIFNIGKSKATLFDKGTRVNITFNDVARLDEAKVEVMEIVDFLKNPKKYTALGGKIPKGALLVRPPGTGKTLLAKAMAGEAQVPFFSLSGSDFVELFVGVGASRVRDLFKQAREKAPCIIFIDEIDAIGRARGKMR